MARGDQLARQWKIIQALSASRHGRSVVQLAGDMLCHKRTVYRDLEALQQAGFPVYNERHEQQTRWRLLDTMRDTMPLPLSLTELMALYFSRGLMKPLEPTFFWEAWESLFAKIKTTLPDETIAFLDQIEKSLSVGGRQSKPHRDIGAYFDTLREAISARRCLNIRYYTISRRSESRRRIAPYKIWYFDGSFYLIADCSLRGDVRLFALDRIKKITLLDERFEMPAGFNADEFMKSSFGVFQGRLVKVRVRFDASVADYIRERSWHPSQTIETQADGAVIFEAEVAGTREIKFWIMQWGAGAQVLSPETLRQELITECARMSAVYAGG